MGRETYENRLSIGLGLFLTPTIDLWPFEASLALPLFVLVLVSLFVGFLAGACVMWITAGKTPPQAPSA